MWAYTYAPKWLQVTTQDEGYLINLDRVAHFYTKKNHKTSGYDVWAQMTTGTDICISKDHKTPQDAMAYIVKLSKCE